MENIFKRIFVIFILGVIGTAGAALLILSPSKEYLDKIEKNFYKNLSRKDITKIIVFVEAEDGLGYKVEITDKEIIEKIKKASIKIYNQGVGSHGGFAQFYTIRLYFNGGFYNFGYSKMIKYKPNECTQYLLNSYNDCSLLHLYDKPNFLEEKEPAESINRNSSLPLLNIDLIPVLREYVDKKIKEDPAKYRIQFENTY